VFAGALAFPSGPIQLREALLPREDTLMTDSRFHEMLDGGPLVDSRGRLLGIHNGSHILPQFVKAGDEDKPVVNTDYDVIVASNAIRAAFPEYLGELAIEAPLDEPPAEEAIAAIAGVAPAVVSVWTGAPEDHPADPDPADPQAQRIAETHGSGVIVDAAGLVLTHAKLFQEENKRASVRLADGRTFVGEVVELDRKKRAALVALELPADAGLPVAELADSTAAIQGEFAAVVGRPFAGAVTMSVGVLSSLERDGLFQMASWTHPGHWGGALVDRRGRLIGIAVEQPHDTERANSESYLGFVSPLGGLLEAFSGSWAVTPAPYTEAEVEERRNAVSRVADRTRGSLINVLVKKALPQADTGFDPFASTEKKFVLRGQGSGVVIHETGLALSNWHVVDAAMNKDGSQNDDFQVVVTLPGDREYVASVLSTSRDDDLALLALELADGEELKPVELGDSDAVGVGEPVVAIGNPLGLQNSVSAGVISATDHDVMIQGRLRSYKGMLMTDAAINPGNSGGALLDIEGRLIGINSAGRVGAGMAIPIEKAREVFSDKLLSTEKTRSVYLGLEVSEDDAGLTIAAVDDGGPAERAALEVGDRLLSYGGEAVSTAVLFARMRLETPAGTPLAVRVERDGEELDVELLPLRFAAWHAFRQSGIEVVEVDYAQESQVVQDACVALHRAYTGDPEGQPRQMMTGALRVTRAAPLDDEHPLAVQAGDLLLGVTAITSNTTDVYERLVRFDDLDDMKAELDLLATKEGSEATFWLLRDGEVVSTRVFARRPPR
jgi:S1-C subfamily serine protease